jgi:dipeptidase E
MTKQIIGFGGGGFSERGDRTALDDYVLDCAGVRRPRICLLPTASGDAFGLVAAFYRAFSDRADASHVPLFQRDGTDLRRHLLDVDIIYVAAGNTASMLAVWRAHGVDELLRAAYDAGVVLAGPSAGAMCWFEYGVTASFGPVPGPLAGLGFLSGSVCPHYDGGRSRRGAYLDLIASGMPGGWGLEEDVAVRWVDGCPTDVVTSRQTGAAWQVDVGPNGVTERASQAAQIGHTSSVRVFS